MPIDRARAKAAGWTDPEIDAYEAKQARPDMAGPIADVTGAGPPAAPAPPPVAAPPLKQQLKSLGQSYSEQTLEPLGGLAKRAGGALLRGDMKALRAEAWGLVEEPVKVSAQELRNIAAALESGDTDAAGKAVAYALPIIGPVIKKLVAQGQQKDVGGFLGTLGGAYTMGAAPLVAPEATALAGKAVRRGAGAAARPMMDYSLPSAHTSPSLTPAEMLAEREAQVGGFLEQGVPASRGGVSKNLSKITPEMEPVAKKIIKRGEGEVPAPQGTLQTIKHIAAHPAVVSRLAIGLYKLAKGKVPLETIEAELAAVAEGGPKPPPEVPPDFPQGPLEPSGGGGMRATMAPGDTEIPSGPLDDYPLQPEPPPPPVGDNPPILSPDVPSELATSGKPFSMGRKPSLSQRKLGKGEQYVVRDKDGNVVVTSTNRRLALDTANRTKGFTRIEKVSKPYGTGKSMPERLDVERKPRGGKPKTDLSGWSNKDLATKFNQITESLKRERAAGGPLVKDLERSLEEVTRERQSRVGKKPPKVEGPNAEEEQFKAATIVFDEGGPFDLTDLTPEQQAAVRKKFPDVDRSTDWGPERMGQLTDFIEKLYKRENIKGVPFVKEAEVLPGKVTPGEFDAAVQHGVQWQDEFNRRTPEEELLYSGEYAENLIDRFGNDEAFRAAGHKILRENPGISYKDYLEKLKAAAPEEPPPPKPRGEKSTWEKRKKREPIPPGDEDPFEVAKNIIRDEKTKNELLDDASFTSEDFDKLLRERPDLDFGQVMDEVKEMARVRARRASMKGIKGGKAEEGPFSKKKEEGLEGEKKIGPGDPGWKLPEDTDPLFDKADAAQYDLVKKKHGKKEADRANYGMLIDDIDENTTVIHTKVYKEGPDNELITTINRKTGEVTHEWEELDTSGFPRGPGAAMRAGLEDALGAKFEPPPKNPKGLKLVKDKPFSKKGKPTLVEKVEEHADKLKGVLGKEKLTEQEMKDWLDSTPKQSPEFVEEYTKKRKQDAEAGWPEENVDPHDYVSQILSDLERDGGKFELAQAKHISEQLDAGIDPVKIIQEYESQFSKKPEPPKPKGGKKKK